ncbi:hypothetical protein JTE90_019501 [Oedothorax gibbosus]|uniref:Sm protein B n=1 Tax=Oedothorax gibbosus TaxID=931172 RepID=A0AAV6VHS0_9ARAC|nr:hypothetical protein JTE90_019501 [Oedothorax gibbosus]
MTVGQHNEILALLNSKMRVVLCDNRTFVGTFSAYDKFMNVVLTDAHELKKYKAKRKPPVEGKQHHDCLVIRGENIVSIIIDSDPPRPDRGDRDRDRDGGSSSRSHSRGRY